MSDIAFGISLIAVVVFVFSLGTLQSFFWEYTRAENQKRKHWRVLADANKLTFMKAKFLEGSYVVGNYRQHLIKLDTIYNWKTTFNRTFIRLTIPSLEQSDQTWDQQKAIAKIKPLFTPHLSPSTLKNGQIEVLEQGRVFYLEHSGIETSQKYLQFVFGLMSDLAEAYSALAELEANLSPSSKL